MLLGTGVSGIDNYAYADTGWTLFAPVTYAGYNIPVEGWSTMQKVATFG
jgi:hypothetical protein